MKETNLVKLSHQYYQQGKRLVAPLLGFPGVELIGSNIKLAQQNFGVHFQAIKELVNRFEPDLIFPLMDLSVEANALGRYTLFPQEDSATVPKGEFSLEQIEQLKDINISFDSRVLSYVETMKLMRVGLPSSVIRGAYITGPYSVAALIMGADDAAMASVTEPEKLHTLCDFVTEKIREYVSLLLSAGAEVICVLEPTAVMLGPKQFEEFSAHYVKHIIDSIQYSQASTVYHTCGNTMHLIGKMVQAGVNAISLDSEDMGVDLKKVAQTIPSDVVVMGNINPATTMLRDTPKQIKEKVSHLLDQMKEFPNYILSTGCDLPQETPPENIEAFMQAGRDWQLK
ncbi:MAG: uroporphyrinogen decarboxylase family protein [Actinomycetota bacterium]|nr:uroporphyrinogen decarboxylase family protein [Actinomycetota bacterium]